MLHSNHLSPKGKEGASPSDFPAPATELMDVRGLAEFLHLDRQTIYNWLHQHKLSGIKVGGVWRFDRRAIELWLQAQTVAANTLHMERRRPASGGGIPGA